MENNKNMKMVVALMSVVLLSGAIGAITVPIILKSSSSNKNFSKNNDSDQTIINKNKKIFYNFNQQLTNNPSPLPDGKISILKLESLAGHQQIPKAINNVKRYFKIKINKVNGVADVSVFITKNNKKGKVIYKISGFETNAQRQAKIVDTVTINNVNVNDLPFPILRNRLPSEVSKPSKDILSPSNVEYEFITWIQDDVNGKITWEAKLTKGRGVPKIVTGILTGFNTDLSRLILFATKQNYQKEIEQEFLKSNRHTDFSLAQYQWNKIIALKNKTLKSINNNDDLIVIKKIKDKAIINLRKLIEKYQNQMIVDFANNMKSTNPQKNYQQKNLPNGFTIPSGITQVPSQAFYGSSFPKGFVLPSSLKLIMSNAFEKAKFISPLIFDNNIELQSNAFRDAIIPLETKITTAVNFPENEDVNPFKNIKIPLWSRWQDSDHNFLRTKDVLKPGVTLKVPAEEEIKFILKEEFMNQTEFPDSFTIPKNVKEILERAFQGSTLPQNFVLPEKIKLIGNSAFKNVNFGDDDFTLEKLENLTIIGDFAFAETKLPNNFNLPPNLLSIGLKSFSNSKINENFEIPDNEKLSIGSQAFSSAKLPNGFKIPKKIKFVKDTFKDAKLPLWNLWYNKKTNTWFANKMIIKNYKNSKFQIKGSKVKKYKRPKEHQHILKFEFTKKNIARGFTIPKGVTVIEEGAFRQATLPSGFILPKTIKIIEKNAFYKATLPNDFKIPTDIDFVDDSAFQDAKLQNGKKVVGS